MRVSPFKLPSRGKTKRIQSNVLSFIFIRLHPSTSLSVSRWNKILSLSPSTPQIFSLSLSLPLPLLSFFLSPLLPRSYAFLFVRFYFISQTRKREFILLSRDMVFRNTVTFTRIYRNDCSILGAINMQQ